MHRIEVRGRLERLSRTFSSSELSDSASRQGCEREHARHEDTPFPVFVTEFAALDAGGPTTPFLHPALRTRLTVCSYTGLSLCGFHPRCRDSGVATASALQTLRTTPAGALVSGGWGLVAAASVAILPGRHRCRSSQTCDTMHIQRNKVSWGYVSTSQL